MGHFCSKCQKVIPYEDCYARAKKATGKVYYECKSCSNNKAKKYYENNKEKARKQIAESKQRVKDFIYSHKTPCVACGESDPLVIDYHHVDPATKSFSLGGAPTANRERLLEEINKCVCLCANCHRKVHHGSLVLPKPDKLADQTSHKPGI